MYCYDRKSTRKCARLCAFRLALACAFALELAGCSTPIFWTDNKALLYLPGAGRRSDEIPGYIRPWERIELIEEKGKKGTKCKPDEKDVLLAQLTDEFEKTDSPNIKRAVIDAMARVSSNYSNPAAEKLFTDALNSDDLALNISASRALGVYCSEGEIAQQGGNARERKFAIETLANRYRLAPYSLEPGSEEENAKRKDVRIAILRALGSFKEEDSPLLLETLELGLNGEKLDDGALMTEASSSLQKITGKKYGLNGETWLQYLEYKRGERSEPPEESSLVSRLPQISNETGIFK